jgi:proteasome lid subunit RPN8/RPN11
MERILIDFSDQNDAMKRFLPDLEIPEELLERVIEHARQEYPLESCGILAGKAGKITNFYPMVNTERSSSSYLMEPEEQLRVFLEMEKKGLELSAIYHSHPHTAAYPSQRDVDYAFYPDSLILIISLMEKEAPRIAAFQIEEGKIERKAVRVT